MSVCSIPPRAAKSRPRGLVDAETPLYLSEACHAAGVATMHRPDGATNPLACAPAGDRVPVRFFGNLRQGGLRRVHRALPRGPELECSPHGLALRDALPVTCPQARLPRAVLQRRGAMEGCARRPSRSTLRGGPFVRTAIRRAASSWGGASRWHPMPWSAGSSRGRGSRWTGPVKTGALFLSATSSSGQRTGHARVTATQMGAAARGVRHPDRPSGGAFGQDPARRSRARTAPRFREGTNFGSLTKPRDRRVHRRGSCSFTPSTRDERCSHRATCLEAVLLS